MKTLLGTEGGNERVILCVAPFTFYLAVRIAGRYYRLWLARWPVRLGWGRS